MNKKRTLVTIIGITLSTALMVGIGLLVSSMLVTERTSAENNYGSYHAYFEDLNEKQQNVVKKNINVAKSYYYTPLGFAKYDTSSLNKPYLYVVGANTDLLNKLQIKEGMLPSNENEIVISENLLSYSNAYKLGDTISLELGVRVNDGEELSIAHNSAIPYSWVNDNYEMNEDIKVAETKEYKIVGVIKDTPYESYDAAGIMVFTKTNKNKGIYNMFVEYKKPAKSYDITNEIRDNLELNNANIKLNANLLYYYGATSYSNINKTIMPLILIALTVISVGCIIVIYNSFAISTMERKKSFGLYASIGTTQRQIKHTVLFEAFIVGIIGIVLGVLGGFLGIYVVIKILNYLLHDTMNLVILFSPSWLYIIIPLIFMVLVILISAYLPAKRSSKVTPIEAIRGNDDIKISKKEVKTPKFIAKLLGIEGVIAYKNIKRNKKKYRITIISLFISIVMFNTFTSFLSYFVKASNSFDYYDFDISVYLRGEESDINKDLEVIKNKYKAKKSLVIKNNYMVTVTNLTIDDFSHTYQNLFLNDLDSEAIAFNIIVLEDAKYKEISNTEGVLLSNKFVTKYSDNERKTYDVELFSKDNYSLNLKNSDGEVSTINAQVINKSIYGLKCFLYESEPTLVVSESVYKEKLANDEFFAAIMMDLDNYRELYDAINDQEIKLNSQAYVFSPKVDEANMKNIILAVNILFYGFIALVTLIGVTSVINTINTNINLRRKEFAMLRSVGLTPRGFNKLLFLESMFFGLKSLIYGLPVSMGINVLISLSVNNVMNVKVIIPWMSFGISIIAVFLIVLISMSYASKKIKKENILEALREENI